LREVFKGVVEGLCGTEVLSVAVGEWRVSERRNMKRSGAEGLGEMGREQFDLREHGVGGRSDGFL
jgi:hypothetical protein